MTNAKNVYALMLALVIVLSGCFGATSDESDAQDSESNDREQTDDRIEDWIEIDVEPDRDQDEAPSKNLVLTAGIYC